MNPQIKTILLTVLTLSCFAIALVELSGVSSTALFNKYHIGNGGPGVPPPPPFPPTEADKKVKEAMAMPKTTIAFDSTQHSFGTIKEGDVVKYSYRFRNTGQYPLLIAKTDVSCGCTTPSYPKEPIPPGGDGVIEVQFNSAHKEGHQQKNVMVHSNAQNESISIGFDADVVKK
ncbi:DUF1573 domain-containing protein [Chitinophagaceae bacterium MMS25-I14]